MWRRNRLHAGGPNDDQLDDLLDGRRDTFKGGNGNADTFFNTTQSGPDRILDFDEGAAKPGDVVKLTDVTTAQLAATYSNSIEACDTEVQKCQWRSRDRLYAGLRGRQRYADAD